MRLDSPSVAILTTQAWPQAARLAVRFAAYGSRVTAICPPASQLNLLGQTGQIAACYPLRAIDPLGSMERAIVNSGADFLVPADDLAVWLLHALGGRAAGHAPLVERSIGSSAGFARTRSRHKLLALAAELGIETPRTERVGSVGEIREVVRRWSGDENVPFVIKKDGTFGGGGVGVVEKMADLPEQYARLVYRPSLRARLKQTVMKGDPTAFLSLPELGEAEFSVQEYVDGVAANAMFACDRGRILGSVQARVVASKEKTGPALMIQLIDDPRIERAGRLLAEALGLSGFFGLDFVLSQDGDAGTPYLIEMNPRCTQLGHVAMAGRPDLAGMLWAHWTGREAPAHGHSALSDSIAFYPQALEWAPDSPFLRNARFDVCEADMQIVDALPTGNAALHARIYRAVRAPVQRWTNVPPPARAGEVFYFSRTNLTGSSARPLNSSLKA